MRYRDRAVHVFFVSVVLSCIIPSAINMGERRSDTYLGRPTCYWGKDIENWYPALYVESSKTGRWGIWLRLPNVYDFDMSKLGIRDFEDFSVHPLHSGDPEATDLLISLLGHLNPTTRRFAIQGLQNIDQEYSKKAAPVLIGLLEDECYEVRLDTREVLFRLKRTH